MSQILFTQENDITNEWLSYIENEAKSLSQRDEFAINNYSDREFMNPELKSYLISEMQESVIDGLEVNFNHNLSLNEESSLKSITQTLHLRFFGLRNKVKKVFCQVVHSMGDLDTKAIIKAVILALIPVFAAGFPAAILPILIGLIAYLIKYGIERTCPV